MVNQYDFLDNITDAMQLIDVINQLDNITETLNTDQRLTMNEISMYLKSVLNLLFNSTATFRVKITSEKGWSDINTYLNMLMDKLKSIVESIPDDYPTIKSNMKKLQQDFLSY